MERYNRDSFRRNEELKGKKIKKVNKSDFAHKACMAGVLALALFVFVGYETTKSDLKGQKTIDNQGNMSISSYEPGVAEVVEEMINRITGRGR